MAGFGSLAKPYVENPFAGRITKVHWRSGGSGPGPLRLVFALHADTAGGLVDALLGTWTVSETGAEDGSVTLSFAGGQADGFINASMNVTAFSGSNIFGSVPVFFVSVAPGADWSMEVSFSAHLNEFSPGNETATVSIWTIGDGSTPLVPFPGFITGTITGAVLEASVDLTPGETGSASGSASGTAPP